MAGEKSKEPVRKPLPTWVNFLFGGLAGMMSIAVVQPADLVKTRMQLRAKSEAGKSVMGFCSEILKHEGVGGFYTGISAALFRQATYTTGRLGCFNVLMDWHKEAYGVPGFGMKLLIGMASGSFGALVGNPAEVALIRMTADGKLPKEQRRNYKNIFNALSRITREEGVTTLWKGALTTCTRAMVVNGAQLSTYSQAREMLIASLGEGIVLHLVSSLISGFVTSVASLPVDMVKTRVQMAKGKSQGQVAVLMNVIKNEGVLTLWSGLLPTYAKIGPMTVLTFIFLEQLNAMYYKYTD